jgi:hypothetical protein
MASHVRILEKSNGSEVLIRPRQRGAALLTVCWLVAWVWGGGLTIRHIVQEPSIPVAISLLGSILWIFVCVTIFLLAAWQILGKEHVFIGDGVVRTERQVGGIRIGKRRTIELSKIDDVRIVEESFRAKAHTYTKRTIAFVSKSGSLPLYSQLQESDAKLLLEGPFHAFVRKVAL